MASAGMPRRAVSANRGASRAAPSSIEYSVCAWRCTNDPPTPPLKHASTTKTRKAMIDRDRLAELSQREKQAFTERNPRSKQAYDRAGHLFGRVPMTWMNKTAAGFPLYLDTAHGATVTDLDGHSYVDFSLGDTAAMAGHSPKPVVEAV